MSDTRLIHGEATRAMIRLRREGVEVDAVVCDPPYELGFMGKDWDNAGVSYRPRTWRAAYCLLPVGGRLLAFGGARTHHRIWCAVEDAGFTIEDTVAWMYGSGFPKHRSKLKPAWEPIVVARKGGVSDLNIDAGRIEGAPRATHGDRNVRTSDNTGLTMGDGFGLGERPVPEGRWPANVALSHHEDCEPVGTRKVKSGTAHRSKSGGKTFGTDKDKPPMPDMTYAGPDGTETVAAWDCHPDCAVRLLDEQSGERRSAGPYPSDAVSASALFGRREQGDIYADSGGASRFYYVSKASRAERNQGLEGMPKRRPEDRSDTAAGMYADMHPPRENHHPTVKPVDLMRWLIRLVAKPGDTTLDPFMGSGTTGVAATLEGVNFIGIEREAEYVDIARRRIAATQPSLFGQGSG